MTQILKIPNKKLRQKAKKAYISSRTLHNLFNLQYEMFANRGLGLAGPQIGIMERIAVVLDIEDDTDPSSTLLMVNPTLIEKSEEKFDSEEGCLSIPGRVYLVPRHKNVTVKYYHPLKGEVIRKAEGLLAAVIQHELDHLDGILISDKGTEINEIKI